MTNNYPEWQHRLLEERAQLKERTDKLLTFLQTEGSKERVGEKLYKIMQEQWEAMMHYYTLLLTRMDILGIDYN